MTEVIRERVQRGVEWLNENHPEWLDKINLEKLDMGQTHTCIIGQVVGESDPNFSCRQFYNIMPGHVAEDRGFDVWDEKDYDYDDLRSVWEEVILNLRN